MAIFLGSAAAIWFAGTQLSNTTDALDARRPAMAHVGLVLRPRRKIGPWALTR